MVKGNVFTDVCLTNGGVVRLWWGGDLPLVGRGSAWKWGLHIGGGLPPPEIRSAGGRYVSYWNAFLFFTKLEDVSTIGGVTHTPVLDF